MKKIFILLVLLAFTKITQGQETAMLVEQSGSSGYTGTSFYAGEDDGYGLSRFALSVNPLGFVQFGPIINAEIGLKKNVVLNTHVRFSSLGLLTYLIYSNEDGLDEFSGIAFGGGPLVFFGERRCKPYAGVLFEFDKAHILYGKGDPWEWEKDTKTMVFICNGGYRFRFEGGLFMNTGLFLGAASTNYEWDYTDHDYISTSNNPHDGIDITPFGMLEFTLGIEF